MSTTSTPRTGVTALLATTVAAGLAIVSLTPSAVSAAAAKAPNLVVAAPTVDVASITQGAVVRVGLTVQNTGTATSGASVTRFYLTRDVAASLAARRASTTNPRSAPADLLLTGSWNAPALAPGARKAATRVAVTVPVGVLPGSYRVLVCADDRGAVKERSETDNCTAAAKPLLVKPAAGSDGLRLEQFADTAAWPDDEQDALRWMKIFCQSTYPVRSFTTASALASVEAYLTNKAGAAAVQEVTASPQTATAAGAENLAAAAVAAGSPGVALTALLDARRMEPRIGTHLLNIAALATSVGLPNEALALVDGSVGLDTRPTPLGIAPQATANAIRGQALTLTGRLPAARTAFSAARQAEPLLTEADAGLAVVEACSGNDAKAMRFARISRQRTTAPKPATEDPTEPEPVRPEPGLDLSQGVVTTMRRLPLAATPTQGVAMRDVYYGIAQGFTAEIDADNAEEDAIRERLRAVDNVSTRAEQDRRDDITTLAYLVGTDGDEVDHLQEAVFDTIDEATEVKEGFFGGGTGEVPYTYRTLQDDASAACSGSRDYSACVLKEMNRTCIPALVGAHSRWEGLMARAQNEADEWMTEASSRMSAYAANLADPDAHRRIMLQVEELERGMYGVLVQAAQQWTNLERIHDDYCVTQQEVETLPAPGDVAAHDNDACGGLLKRMTITAELGPTKMKINCEKVSQEFSVEAIPALSAFVEVQYDFRTGKVTWFAGSKFKAGVGPVEAGFKSGIYLSTDGRGNIADVGWRVGPDVKASSGPVSVSAYKDSIDLSFLGGLGIKP